MDVACSHLNIQWHTVSSCSCLTATYYMLVYPFPNVSQPLGINILFSAPMSWSTFYVVCVRSISFYTWLISCNIMICGFIHVVTNDKIFIFATFSCSVAEEHELCFHFGCANNSSIYWFLFFRLYRGLEMEESYGTLILKLLSNWHNLLPNLLLIFWYIHIY